MLIKIWDFLFTRRVWTIIQKVNIIENENDIPSGYLLVLQDQFGNIKKKRISV